MGLIVEDGTLSTPSANSYVDRTYCDAFCSARGFTSWATLSTDEKEQAVFRAMDYIEGFDFKGVKVEDDDPLKWPRENATDEDGYAIDDDEIPPNLLKAVAQAAYLESVTIGVLLPSYQTNIKREKVDVIEIEYFDHGQPSETIYAAIMGYLKGLIKITGFARVLRT